MEEGERPHPSPTQRASTDRELSLQLQNHHKAIDPTRCSLSCVFRCAHYLSGVVFWALLHLSVPAVEFDKWLIRARLDKPTKFDGQSGEGGDSVKAFLYELQR